MPSSVELMYAPHRLGHVGESLAADYLHAHGYQILDQNWRSPFAGMRGELDIIARYGHRLVFIEVKSSSHTRGHALAHVTNQKCRQLQALVRAWRQTHPDTPGVSRGDVIAVHIPQHQPDAPELLHLEGVW